MEEERGGREEEQHKNISFPMNAVFCLNTTFSRFKGK
jgi:hypothetical protein